MPDPRYLKMFLLLIGKLIMSTVFLSAFSKKLFQETNHRLFSARGNKSLA